MKSLKGILKAKSIQDYALFNGKKEVYSFTVTNIKKRQILDKFQGQEVTVEKVDKILR
jgi:hypothetical protein